MRIFARRFDYDIDIIISAIHNGVAGYPGRPNIKIGLLPNFANYNYNGTPDIANRPELAGLNYYQVLSQVVSQVKAAGETLWFLHADSPYELTVLKVWPNGGAIPNQGYDYLGRLIALGNQARSLNLRFAPIFNSDRSDDSIFFNDTLAYISAVRNRGLDPDDFMLESWNQPANSSLTFPESQSLTFMNLVQTVSNPSAPATY